MFNISLLSWLSSGITLTATAGALVATTSTAALPLLQNQQPPAPVTTSAPVATAPSTPSPSAEDSTSSSGDALVRGMRNTDIGGGNMLHDVKPGLTASGQAGGALFTYVGPCNGSTLSLRIRGNNNQFISASSTPCSPGSGSSNMFVSNWLPWDANTKNSYCYAPVPATAYRAEVNGMVTQWIAAPAFDCGGEATPQPPTPTPSYPITPTPEPAPALPEPPNEPAPATPSPEQATPAPPTD